jgi:ABC-type transport system substrate-binding protein
VLQRVDRDEADWGHTLAGIYFDPALGLVEKYGINRSRLFLRPGLTLRTLAFNSARPLFRNNPGLRKAVNFALDRQALAGSSLVSPPTDQYLPSLLPGFKNEAIYPLGRADLQRARTLARGNLRSATAVLYVNSSPIPMAVGLQIKQQLAEIGLDVEVRGIPIHSATAAYFNKLGTPGEAWDLAIGLWSPSYIDPYAYINSLYDSRFIGGTNFARFSSGAYDRQMRRAARLSERGLRNSAYGALDAALARDQAPSAALGFLNEPTLVSKRVGCIVLRPVLDLTAVCLES